MKVKVLLLFVIFLSVAAITGIYIQNRKPPVSIRVSLPDEKGNWHQIETDIIPQASPENLAKAMDFLFQGIAQKNLPPVFPEEVEYYGISVKEDTIVEVNFKEGYLKMPELQRGLCETAMVRTFTGFPLISKLYLYEEGIPLPVLGRSAMFGLSSEDAHLSFEEELEKPFRTKQTIYFYKAQTKKLVAEKKEITRQAYESEGKAILQALAKGTETEGLSTLLTENIKINAVRIRNQVCYVDFSQDFVKEYADMGTNKRLMIYSIVNTLADLENVEYVQFLINGENPEKYPETENIKSLFRKNYVFVE